MKKRLIYFLILIISCAYCYDTVEYLTKNINGSSVSWMKDFHCEEKGSETEESNEETKKLHFSEELNLHNLFYNRTAFNNLHSTINNNFSSSDYSQVVYSPPENILPI